LVELLYRELSKGRSRLLSEAVISYPANINDLIYSGENSYDVIEVKSETKEGRKVADAWREERIR
jgi:hypothetical protein